MFPAAEEIQPLSDYTILMNDDEEILVLVPGCYKGMPLVSKVYYNGGKHALFIRNQHEYVTFDYVHEDVRGAFAKLDKILIYESDMRREYVASVVHEDVDRLCDKAVDCHDDSSIDFRPFPTMAGGFKAGSVRRPKHCEGPCAYLGVIEPEDINEEIWEEALENWNDSNTIPQSEANEILARVRAFELNAHMFRCDRCKRILLNFVEE